MREVMSANIDFYSLYELPHHFYSQKLQFYHHKPRLLQSLLSCFNSEIVSNNVSLNSFQDKTDLQCKKPKDFFLHINIFIKNSKSK